MPNTKTTFLRTDKFYMIRKIQSDPVCDSTWAPIYHDVGCLFFFTFSKADLLEDSLKKSALNSRSKKLSVLTKLKTSLGTNLSQSGTLIFGQTTNA